MTRPQRMDQLAELISEDVSLEDAAAHMGVSYGYVRNLWADIKDNLGPQAD